MFSSIAYSNDFLNLKNMQKKENTWKLKKQNFKTEKKTDAKSMVKKRKNKKGKNNGKKWTFAFFWHLWCFFDLFVFFYSHFFQAKSKINTK